MNSVLFSQFFQHQTVLGKWDVDCCQWENGLKSQVPIPFSWTPFCDQKIKCSLIFRRTELWPSCPLLPSSFCCLKGLLVSCYGNLVRDLGSQLAELKGTPGSLLMPWGSISIPGIEPGIYLIQNKCFNLLTISTIPWKLLQLELRWGFCCFGLFFNFLFTFKKCRVLIILFV